MKRLLAVLFICTTIAYPLTQRTKTEDGAFFLLEGVFSPRIVITKSGIAVAKMAEFTQPDSAVIPSDQDIIAKQDSIKKYEVPENQDYSVTVAPNPFNPTTNILITLPRGASVEATSMKIIDVRGSIVKSFNCSSNSRQMYNLLWNGLNNNGQHVGPGMYFFVLKSGNKTLQNKLILAK